MCACVWGGLCFLISSANILDFLPVGYIKAREWEECGVLDYYKNICDDEKMLIFNFDELQVFVATDGRLPVWCI